MSFQVLKILILILALREFRNKKFLLSTFASFYSFVLDNSLVFYKLASMNFQLIVNECHSSEKGSLFVFESLKTVPFDIKRVFFIKDVPHNCRRGQHAHKTVKQFVTCLAGTCKFILDDGKSKQTIHLSSSSQGLYIDIRIWGEMYDFSPDCILMVLASDFYDPEEYVRDYQTFLSICCA